MDTALFIDQMLTPIAGGIGGAIGMFVMQKKKQEFADMGWKMPILVGVLTFCGLLAFKMLSGT